MLKHTYTHTSTHTLTQTHVSSMRVGCKMCRGSGSGVCRAAGGGGLLAGGSSWVRPETGSFGGLRGASVTLGARSVPGPSNPG